MTAQQVHGPLHDSDAVGDCDNDDDDDDVEDDDDDENSYSAEVGAQQVHGPVHGKL